MSRTTVEHHIQEIETLLAKQLGLRGRDLGQQLARAGRRLPRAQRARVQELEAARQLLLSPKMAHRVDPEQIGKAHGELRRWLKSLSPLDRFLGGVLGISASVAFGLLVLTGGVIAVLVWRGFV